MDLFQPEESCWATQKANKMLVKSVFSVQKVSRLWVHGMWCGGVWHIGTNILVEPGISIFRVRRRELSYPEEGGQQVPPNCLGLSTKPHGVTSCDFILNILKSPIITYHMPRFNIHEHQGHWTAHQIPLKICSKFLPSQNTWWCPPSEPVQQWEFTAVVCSGVTLTGGFGYK